MNENTLLTPNGRKTGDTLGTFTCHEHNGSSTVHTAITSWEIYDKVQYFKVLDLLYGFQITVQFSFLLKQPIYI